MVIEEVSLGIAFELGVIASSDACERAWLIVDDEAAATALLDGERLARAAISARPASMSVLSTRMALFIARWPDGSAWIVDAESMSEIAEILDEIAESRHFPTARAAPTARATR